MAVANTYSNMVCSQLTHCLHHSYLSQPNRSHNILPHVGGFQCYLYPLGLLLLPRDEGSEVRADL